MDDEGSTRAQAFAALGVAVLFVGLGTLFLRNWLISEVVGNAVAKQPYAFPTAELRITIALTPFAMPTPLFQPGMWDLSTPTPVTGNVYIVSPHR